MKKYISILMSMLMVLTFCCSCSAEETTQTAEPTQDILTLKIGSQTAYLNGEAAELDAAPVIIDGRTMLPIRFIAESFGLSVDRDSETQEVTITKSNEAAEAAETPMQAPEAEETAENGKTLVVYFSATGSTETIANYIAEETNADIFKIEPTNPYTDDDLNRTDEESRVCKEHDDETLRTVPLKTTEVPQWETYDTVFIGYPIWWGIAAWPASSFVAANDFTGKTVIPFCTSASSGLGESGELLEEAAGTGSWLAGERFSSGASEETVKDWAREKAER